jgi:VanZ family protein
VSAARDRFWRWAPAVAWAVGIFSLSAQSTLPQPPAFLAWDKLQHSVAYALGGFLIARAVGVRGRGTLLAVMLGSLFGVSDELHQWFVPGRNADVLDWVADTLGVLAGAHLFRFFSLRRGRAVEVRTS